MKIGHVKIDTDFGIQNRVGILLEENLFLDVNSLWEIAYEQQGYYSYHSKAQWKAPSKLSLILENYQDASIDFFKESYELYQSLKKSGESTSLNGKTCIYDLSKNYELAAPLDKINCYRDFYAHLKHVEVGFKKRNEKIPEAWFELPAYYKGATSGFIGPNDEILWPSYTNLLDYELEFGLVISRDGKNIKANQVQQYIFGYTIFNDISARDIQKKEMSIRLGPAKGKDFCSVIGPVIVTKDEFADKEPNLKMTAKINGELWSEGYTGDSHFTWAQMIEHASKDEWLRASDFMGSGTVGTGCGLEIDKWIQPGDKIELEIEKIGILKNKVGLPQSSN